MRSDQMAGYIQAYPGGGFNSSHWCEDRRMIDFDRHLMGVLVQDAINV